MLLKRTRRNNPQFFYKNSYKEINLVRKHFPFLTYHKTKRDLNDEHIRQIPFIIHRPKSIKNPVKSLKIGVPDRSRTYDLSLRSSLWRLVCSSSIILQGTFNAPKSGKGACTTTLLINSNIQLYPLEC